MFVCDCVCVCACVGSRVFPQELMIAARPRAVCARFKSVAAHERLISGKQREG